MNTTEDQQSNGIITSDSKFTPITNKPIPQIDADDWANLSINELYDQQSFLHTRLNIVAQNSGHPDIMAQMRLGIARIEAIIQAKNQDSQNSTDQRTNTTVGII